MKLHHIMPLLLAFLPLALSAQAGDSAGSDVAVGDVVIEVPNQPVPGVSADEEIPVVTAALPADAEVVLELPGQQTGGSASVAEEETISVDFPDEDVRTILRNVAELFDLNLVIPDTLQGRTSLKLRNVTWRQVFDVVLEPLDYTYVEDRNIISVKSVEELDTEPVDTRVFVANYASAADLSTSIAALITSVDGRVQVDQRSNALVITERPSKMNKIQEVIERLDQPNQQVMIESKFVEVEKSDQKDIGINWAYIDVEDGNLLPVRGASGFGDGEFSFPGTNPGDYLTGGLLAVFSRGEFAAALNALETDGNSRLVSNPTVVVMNNEEAIFQVGEDYPLRELTLNTETGQIEPGEIEYRFVGIRLKVTPSVNASGMIRMDIEPEVSARDPEKFVENTFSGTLLRDQIFDLRNAETNVTIKDGFTIAIGGLTEEATSETRDQVPFLGDLPMLGKLFQSNSDTERLTNLIVFLTAKTLNPDGATYEDIVDPRQISDMELTDRDMPGYNLSEADEERMERLRELREETSEAEEQMKFESEESEILDRQFKDGLYKGVRNTFKGTPRYQLRRSR